MDNYKEIPIQNIIYSDNVQNTMNRLLNMQNTKKLEFVENATASTPLKIVKEMIEALPKEVWNHNTRFLNIACKDGIFMIEIFKKLMQSEEMKSYIENDLERAWYILENQLYAICIDETTARLLESLVYGMSNLGKEHITWFGDLKAFHKLKDIEIEQYIYNRFKITGSIDKKETTRYMKFDVVVGNPPYNRGGTLIL